MRHYRYVEPGENNEPIVITLSEQEILDTYYSYWQEQMRQVGKADLISPELCLEDFVVVHWAEELPEA